MENYIKPSCKIIKLNTANTILAGSPDVNPSVGDQGWTAPDVDGFNESEYGGF